MQLKVKATFFIFLAFISTFSGFSQIIKGRITDQNNAPVPFAVVYDETSLTGTTSNTEGFYEFKLEPGSHSLLFKAMGYYQVREVVVLIGDNVNRDIRLREQPVELKEVVIRPGREDPAYAMMRKVISLAPYHLNQVRHYIADVYLRGTAHIIKMPKFISKRTAVDGEAALFKSGDVYMEESVNQVTFQAPDNYEQKVLSIKSTFPWNNEEINPMGLINSSLYEPEIEDFISPLAPNAFQFYNYKYEGFFEEGGRAIFKINVIPKRNSQQLMRGNIFIVDQLWCLHSADVSIAMFFGTINYKIIYSPVKGDAWLPVSYQFYVDASMVGIKANFRYASSVKFRDVELNEKAIGQPVMAEPIHPKQDGVAEPKKTKNQQEIEELLAKEELTNRDMVKIATKLAKESKGDTVKIKSLEIQEEEGSNNKVVVEEDAVKSDTAYWNTIRPIPLSKIEAGIPHVSQVKKTESGKDTLTITAGSRDNKNRVISKISRFITNGAGFRLFDSTMYVRYDGIIGLKKIDFNTVDGFVYKQSFGIEQTIDSLHKLKINPGVAYAFSRKRLMWWTDLNYEYAPLRGGNLAFHISSQSADYNDESGINSNLNTLASLVFRRNYLKVYHRNLAYIENRIDLANGLNLLAQAGYRTALPLENHSDYSFFYREERDYTPNIPGNRTDVAERNIYNEEAYWDVRLEFTPRYFYRIRGGKKHYEHSAYPTLIVRHRMAIPGIVKSTADYSFLETGLRQHITWAMMHEFSWSIQGGFFLNRDRIYAMDDKYLNNQNLPVIFTDARDAFRLLPYYRYAITDKYGEVHMRYTTPYLLFKYLPFLSNKLWVENLHLSYLAGGSGLHYWEAGYSMGQIYMIANIGVFAGFNKDNFRSWGVQASFDL